MVYAWAYISALFHLFFLLMIISDKIFYSDCLLFIGIFKLYKLTLKYLFTSDKCVSDVASGTGTDGPLGARAVVSGRALRVRTARVGLAQVTCVQIETFMII